MCGICDCRHSVQLVVKLVEVFYAVRDGICFADKYKGGKIGDAAFILSIAIVGNTHTDAIDRIIVFEFFNQIGTVGGNVDLAIALEVIGIFGE